MKRAQINNIFTILITLLIVSTIAVLSVRFINNLLDDRCSTDQLLFERDLRNAIEKGNNFGAVDQVRLSNGCEVRTLCLVDATRITNDLSDNSFSAEGRPLLEDSVRDQVEANIFSYTEDGIFQEQGYVRQLQLENPQTPLCVNATSGGFEFRLEGKAVTTLVTLP